MIINSYEDYKTATKEMYKSIDGLVNNPQSIVNCLIISGEPGIGKTYQADAVLDNTNRPWIKARSVSPIGLYRKMWDCPNGIILFEDSDSILVSKGDATTLLKAAADMYQSRELEWYKNNFNSVKIPSSIHGNDNIAKYIEMVAKKDPKKMLPKYERGELFPNRFTFTGQLIILTNKTLKEITDKTDTALANRSIHLELIMSRDGAFDVIKHAEEILGNRYDKQKLKNVVDFLTSQKTREYCELYDKQPSLRTINKVLHEISLGKPLDELILDTCLEDSTFKTDSTFKNQTFDVKGA